MAEFKLEVAKLTGPTTDVDSGWAQIHTFRPQDPEKFRKRGEIVAVLSANIGKSGIDAFVAGREILSRLHEEYFGSDLNQPVFDVLKASLKKIGEEFKDVWDEVEISAMVMLGGVVYLGVNGGSQIVILREGRLARVLVGNRESVLVASGFPQDGDLVLLGTSAFFTLVADGILRAALQSKNPELAVEALAPLVRSNSRGSLGVAVASFNKITSETSYDAFSAPQEPTKPSQLKPSISLFARLKGLRLPILPKKVGGFVSRRSVYVRNLEAKESFASGRKVASLVGLILIFLLALSIFFGARQRRIAQEKARYEPRLLQAQHELEEAQSISSLNPTRSRELVVSATTVLKVLREEGVTDPRLDELANQIEKSSAGLLGEYRVEAEQFIDLTLQREGFKADLIVSSGDEIAVLDKDGKRVVNILITTKKTEVVAGSDQVGEARAIALYSGRNFVLGSDGVYEIGSSRKKVAEGEGVGFSDALIYAYAGNLYVLDRIKGKIWRYPAITDGFGAEQAWLGAGINPDFSNIVSWSFDGSIWLLSAGGRLYKYTLGSPDGFSVSGLIPSLSSATAVYTNEELAYLYILDREGKRVVVLDKEGNYKAQYISDKIGEATGLVVSEKDAKIILAAGSKLIEIALRHL